MPNPQTGEEIGRILNRAMYDGAIQAFYLLWPYLLVALVLGFAIAYVNGRLRRAERDREYRRMAQAFREVVLLCAK